MSSERCAERIQAALEALPDVHATVLFASSRASVRYRPGVVSPEQMVRAVELGGFQAHAVEGGQRGEERARRERAWQRERREFLIAAVLTVPLMAEMVGMFFGSGHLLPGWLQALLATPVQFWSGRHFYRCAWSCITQRHLQHGRAGHARDQRGLFVQSVHVADHAARSSLF
ncbi:MULTISPECIES: cation transporter [Symbiopectobacterium]|uniref:cation transporter n=1 Tax=Symbiopectobacterium TaxID=801 RepID=UPI00207A43CF|nr:MULTISPECIES: cation transporter [Symbiopectobacterium]MBT9430215.1 cation-translocating P-type ATPase [Candidatus Symbiopectobacterium endolongispinus]